MHLKYVKTDSIFYWSFKLFIRGPSS